jgi:hypothetical protein
LDRKKYSKVDELAIKAGWTLSENRNQALIWKNQLHIGRIEWWATGRVRVHVEKPINLGRAKQLVYNAFVTNSLIGDRVISEKFLADVEWYESHDVYETDRKLPYSIITSYGELGIKAIKTGDSSNPKAIEIEIVKAPIIEKYEELVGKLTVLFDKTITSSELEKARLVETVEESSKTIRQFNAFLQAVSAPKGQTSKHLYE